MTKRTLSLSLLFASVLVVHGCTRPTLPPPIDPPAPVEPPVVDPVDPSEPPPEGPPQVVSVNARQGQLRLEGAFVDDSGDVLPLYAHAGNLFAVFVRDPPRARLELDKVAEAGYHGVRVWGTLGCGVDTALGCHPGDYWLGHEVGPDVTPGYWDRVYEFAGELRLRGLRAVWSQGDVGQLRDRRDYMNKLAARDLDIPFVDVLDCGNEAWQTGEPDPRKLAECVGHYRDFKGRALRTLTSAQFETKADVDRYSIEPAQLYDVHTFRSDHSWDKRRHIWNMDYELKPQLPFGIGSEPPGHGASVTANEHELDDESVPLLAVASMLGRQAFVWFSGEGVKLDRGLDVEPGFWSTPKAIARLPRDVMRWPAIFHSGSGTERILGASGESRIDCRSHSDGRFACTIDGPAGSYRYRVYKSFAGIVCNPSDDVCVDVSRTVGEDFDLAFERGRVFIGTVH